MRTSRNGVACLLVIALAAMHARARAEAPDWNALDADTHTLLAPWQEGWSTLSASERQRLLAHAAHWQSMDASARTELLKRNAQWQALPPSERARLRARYAAWKALPSEDRARVDAAAAKFAALPAPQQSALRSGFATLEINQQDAWLMGPSTGSWIAQARTLFAFVPDGERDATLRMLQDLPADAREQLFTLAGRLSGDERERLRRELMLQDPHQRPSLIRERISQ